MKKVYTKPEVDVFTFEIAENITESSPALIRNDVVAATTLAASQGLANILNY